MTDVLAGIYPEIGAGGFTRDDGTIQFYGRIAALVQPAMVVLDLGAGRGCQFEDHNAYRRDLRMLRGKVAKVIGVDVDPAVLSNEYVDERHVFDGKQLPCGDASIDLVVSDWVLEHVMEPASFAAEAARVLKPGGWFCARTPASLSLIALASRVVPNRNHARLLDKIQHGARKEEDVFPAYYRLNSRRALNRYFPPQSWENFSYSWSPEPSYHFGSSLIARALRALQFVKAPFSGENLFVFLRRR
ncbi:MAG: class I SAM-dependent methyltransferase [Tsuneonella sp.]